MDFMTIGAFAGRTRLSAKALRLYDRLGLLPPARVDPDSGYRFYREDQVATARLIALLRRLGMPLTAIADIAVKPPGAAAEAVGAYWADVEEVYIRVAMKDMGWPGLAPAVDALEAWMRGQRREPAGSLRQVLIGDQRTAKPDTPVCDLSIPLR